MCAVSAVHMEEDGNWKREATPIRFINFVGSFREPGSNATLTGLDAGCWMLDGDLQLGVFFFFCSVPGVPGRSLWVPPAGSKPPTGDEGRVEAGERGER